jgi:hypothetical protein
LPLIVTEAVDIAGGSLLLGSGRKIFDLSRLNDFVSLLANGSMEIFSVCLLPEESVCLEPMGIRVEIEKIEKK